MSERRRLAVILGALAAGAVINVAVVWGCALLSPIRSAMYMPDGPNVWPLDNDFGWPAPQYQVGFESPGLSGVFASADLNRLNHVDMSVHRFGLPMRSMLVGIALTDNGVGTSTNLSMGWVTDGLVVPPTWDRDGLGKRRLPLRPEWPGFAVNTAVFAAGLLPLGAIWGQVRRWRRCRHGTCLACGYASGGLAVCPECGEGAP
jgi:hypothetical protein